MKTKSLNFALILLVGLFLASCSKDELGPISSIDEVALSQKTVLTGSYALSKGTVSWKPEASHKVHDCDQFTSIVERIEAGSELNGEMPLFNIDFDQFGNYTADYSVSLASTAFSCDEETISYFLKPPVAAVKSNESGTYIFILGENGSSGTGDEIQGIILTSTEGKITRLELTEPNDSQINDDDMLNFNVKGEYRVKMNITITKVDA